MILRNRTIGICALLYTLSVGVVVAHDDEEFQNDRQPPYDGPGWRAAEGGAPSIFFPQSGLHLLSWIPLVEFDSSVTSADDCWGYVSPSGREYALIGLSIGTGFVDVTVPEDARIVTVLPGPNSIWRDIKIYQHYAYAVSEGGSGIQVFDLDRIDEGIVTHINTVTTGGRLASHNVAIDTDSGFLYRVGGGGANPVRGLRAYSLLDPENPEFVGEWNDRYCHDAQVVLWTQGPLAGRQIAFCFANDFTSGGNPGLDILDVTDKKTIALVGSVNLSVPPIFSHPAKFSHNGSLSIDRRYVYLGDEIDEGSLGTPTTTRVIDVADLTNPMQVATFSNGNSARDHNLYTVGNLIYEANYRSGLRVYDATDPLAPVEIAFFDTYPDNDRANFNGLWNVYPFFPSGVVVGSDIEKGLFVWGIGDAAPQIPVPAAAPHDRRKNRYLSFTPRADSPLPVAYRVEQTDRACGGSGRKCASAADCRRCAGGGAAGSNDGTECVSDANCDGFCEVSGESCDSLGAPATVGWVGEPRDPSCQNLDTGDILAGSPPCLGNDFVSRVVTTPVMRSWAESVVHVGDCEIAPAQAYDLCATFDETVFSPPLALATIARPGKKFWGDVAGDFDETGWTEPNGIVNVNDIVAWVNFVTQRPAPHLTAVDLGGEAPNWVVNATDLQLILRGFGGSTYPPPAFSASTPLDCP